MYKKSFVFVGCMGVIEARCSIGKGSKIIGYEFDVDGKKVSAEKGNLLCPLLGAMKNDYYVLKGDDFDGKDELQKVIDKMNLERLNRDLKVGN